MATSSKTSPAPAECTAELFNTTAGSSDAELREKVETAAPKRRYLPWLDPTVVQRLARQFQVDARQVKP